MVEVTTGSDKVSIREFDGYEIGFTVAQGQGETLKPQSHWILQGSTPANGYLRAGNKTHVPDPAAELTLGCDGLDDAVLVHAHFTQIDNGGHRFSLMHSDSIENS
jgi:hypothetical protein